MRTILFTALVLLFATVGFAQQPATDNPRVINTNGDATVYVTPDQVIVNVGVETFNRNLEESRAANTISCTKLLGAIKTLGVDDKNVQTDVMQVEIAYNNHDASNGISGYFCRRGYQITLKDPKLFETFITTVIQNGANRLLGFEFRSTELRKHRDEARQMAIRAAKEKAAALAAELGARIGKPRSISENSGGYYGYQSYWGWGGGGFSSGMSQNISADRNGGSGDVGDTMRLGQIAISAQVSVSFDLLTE